MYGLCMKRVSQQYENRMPHSGFRYTSGMPEVWFRYANLWKPNEIHMNPYEVHMKSIWKAYESN